MSTIVLRSVKGSPLTNAEVDANFSNLNTDKVEKTAAAITGGTINNTSVGATTPSTGAFTTLSSTGNTTLGDATADTVTINGTVQPGVVISGSSTGDALRITQTGTGNALVVEDSANPDATPFVVDANGRVGIGSAPLYSVDGLSIYAATSFSPQSFSRSAASDGSASYFNFEKVRGSSIVQSGDDLGTIAFRGFDGTQQLNAAWIMAEVDGTPGTNDMPGRLVFATTADGAVSPTERMRLDSSGNVGIGTGAPAARFAVSTGDTRKQFVVNTSTDPVVQIGLPDWYNIGSLAFINGSGGERMRIDSSGNVGIGTSSPGAKLQIEQNQAAYTYVDLVNTTAGGGAIFRQIVRNIANSGTTSVDFAKLIGSGLAINNNDTNAANFTSFGVGASERMRLDSSGNVGIGTSSPANKLDVAGNGLFTNATYGFVGVNSGTVQTQFAANAGAGLDIRVVSNHVMNFFTNNVERMRINSAGNVGIGTSSPDQRLRVVGTSGTAQFGAGTAGNAVFINAFDSDTIYMTAAASNANAFGFGSASNIPTYFMTNNTERMRIDSSGNVGIGTSTPSTFGKLNVIGNIVLGNPTRNQSASAAIGTWTTNDPADNIRAFIDFVTVAGVASSSSYISFNTNNYGVSAGERMRIDSAGNVGIGTSSPSAFGKLAVAGNLGTMSINADGDQLGFSKNGFNYITASGAAAVLQIQATGASGVLTFGTAGSERMRITAAGNVGIGTSSPDAGLTVIKSATISSQVNVAARIGSGVTSDLLLGSLNGNAPFVASQGAYPLIFYTNAAERARIDSSGNVGIGTISPSASAILDAQSTTKGVRMPNMTTTQKNAIASPAAGLMVFDTTLSKLCVYSGTAWETITSI
jgi:hypothetical protein